MEEGSERIIVVAEDGQSEHDDDQAISDYSTSTIFTEPGVPTWREKLTPILIGQVASVLICLTGVLSEYFVISTGGVSYPSSQNLVSYLMISCVFTTKLAFEGTRSFSDEGEVHYSILKIFKERGWKYLLIALADVGGNYLVVRAYQYTSLTSVQATPGLPTEFLGCLGLIGTLVSALQTVILEPLAFSNWSLSTVLLLLGFGVTQFAFYTIIANLMRMTSSVAVNLLILSADFYSILVGIFVFQYTFTILYILSFVLVLGGVSLYHSRKT